MATDVPTSQTEEFVERRVRYSLDLSDRFVVIENVPSRVSSLTGEQFFTPQTVERIWEIAEYIIFLKENWIINTCKICCIE